MFLCLFNTTVVVGPILEVTNLRNVLALAVTKNKSTFSVDLPQFGCFTYLYQTLEMSANSDNFSV